MNRVSAFCSRNLKEMIRDPLSYIFCLGFPIVMLVIMSIVNSSIPAQAGMTIYRIDNLSGGIAVFGQTFVMMFTALTVSKDRCGSFLVRMYSTPMRSADFCTGYIVPMILISIAQLVITFAASLVISLVTGYELKIAGLLLALITMIPSELLFAALGLLFGTIFNDKAAPGMCSLVISLGSFLGCIWFDADKTGGVMLTICKCLPFYYCTRTARATVSLDFGMDSFVIPLIVVVGCAAVITALSVVLFSSRMKADLS